MIAFVERWMTVSQVDEKRELTTPGKNIQKENLIRSREKKRSEEAQITHNNTRKITITKEKMEIENGEYNLE